MTDEQKICPKCGRPMYLRKGPYGEFYGCSGYKDEENPCKHIEKINNGVKGEAKAVTKATAKTTTAKLAPDTVIKELKQTYDEVTAEFGADYPETIADPKALQALVASVFIEKNNRKKGR